MTCCVGIELDAGLVFLPYSHTSAGRGQIGAFRETIIYERPADRFMVPLPAGNRSIGPIRGEAMRKLASPTARVI
jgi:predicted proteasome-type protease